MDGLAIYKLNERHEQQQLQSRYSTCLPIPSLDPQSLIKSKT